MEDADEAEETSDSDFYDDDVPSWDDDDDAFGLKDSPDSDSGSPMEPPSTEEPQSNFALDLFRANWINDIGEGVVSKLADRDVAQAVELIQKCENKRAHVNDLRSALAPRFVALPYDVWFLIFEDLDVTSVVHLGLACSGGYAASWRYIEQVTERRDLGHGDHTIVTASGVDKSTRILRIHGDKAATVSPRGPRPMPNVVLSTVPERVEHLIVHDVCVRFSTVSHALPRFAGVVCMDLRSSKRKAMRFSKHSLKCPRNLADCLYYFAGNERDLPRLRRMRGVLVSRSRKYDPDETKAERKAERKQKSATTNTFIIKSRTWTVDRNKGTVFGDSDETHHIVDPVTGSLAPRDNDDDTAGLCCIDSDEEHVDYKDRWWF
ncbi:hypothetical protein ml_116 [Mollivirus sibericum]|uniref:hypothetical protein n=1 Tax=Mollivirus sibericum TaxID=1678078 RepID=UPI0006B2EA25|nr:hypothetical protein ml_116 [Mollivirus sibericum]ALD61918.1 hypothetical protein ml_116 [Mollivirus sibericum]